MNSAPTIKGIFVNSHIKSLRKEKGDEAVLELEKTYGKSVIFKNDENVPVREEVKIIEYVLDILTGNSLSGEERAYEAGRLHFKNFSNTPLAKILFSLFARSFKLLMLQSKNIAAHVFNGVQFESRDIGENAVEVTMENNDYPLAHFTGFFQAWMDFSGLQGKVTGKQEGEKYIYTMEWQ